MVREKWICRKGLDLFDSQQRTLLQVQDTINDIAVSEETLKAKEAKLLAMKKEKEAMEAEEEAAKKEEEAKVSIYGTLLFRYSDCMRGIDRSYLTTCMRNSLTGDASQGGGDAAVVGREEEQAAHDGEGNREEGLGHREGREDPALQREKRKLLGEEEYGDPHVWQQQEMIKSPSLFM